MILDIASIVFVSVTMNHLGLIRAVEERIGHELPVVNCPKCLSFWSVLAYTIISYGIFTSLAVSFLASYISIWLELLEGYIDTLYDKIYDTVYPSTDKE